MEPAEMSLAASLFKSCIPCRCCKDDDEEDGHNHVRVQNVVTCCGGRNIALTTDKGQSMYDLTNLGKSTSKKVCSKECFY